MIKALISDIASDEWSFEQIFQKHFVNGPSYFFTTVLGDINREYFLRRDVANVLCVHINDVYIIGSAKTGFSMNKNRYGAGFDSLYSETKQWRDRSDIDIAVVSEGLFDFLQENIYDWSAGFKKSWEKNSYYPDGLQGVGIKYKFFEYLARGRFRPDYAPVDYCVSTRYGRLDNIGAKWRKDFKRKVSFAFYKNWNFFTKYQLENLRYFGNMVRKGDFL